MYLSGSLVGYNAFINYIPIPSPVKYNRISVFGEQSVKFIHLKEGILTNSEIESTYEINYIPQLDNKTLLLTNFNNSTLYAGNLNEPNGDITSWNIYREEIGKNQLEFVKNIPYGINQVQDYMPKNNIQYVYHIFPETINGTEARIVSEQIITDWWNWQLMSLNHTNIDNTFTPDEIFQFDLNLSSGDAQGNYDITKFDGFSQFSKINIGKRNYISGSIDALIGYIDSNGDYIDTVDMVNKLRSFVNNGKRKILKDRKGNIYEISLSNLSHGYIDETIQQVTKVKFDYIQIGDASNIIVTS